MRIGSTILLNMATRAAREMSLFVNTGLFNAPKALLAAATLLMTSVLSAPEESITEPEVKCGGSYLVGRKLERIRIDLQMREH